MPLSRRLTSGVALACLLVAWQADARAAQPLAPDAAPEAAEVEQIASETMETRQTLIEMAEFLPEDGLPEGQSLVAVKLQILLDRANASPGVIDGFKGNNSMKAIRTFERMRDLPVDGELDAEVWTALEGDGLPVMQLYEITAEDLDRRFEPLPEDYAELAELEAMGFTSPEEMLAERFHMDIDLLRALNPGVDFTRVGTRVLVAQPEGKHPTARITRIEANRTRAEIYAYAEDGTLVTAYPATIGSSSTPSPSGTHTVQAVAFDPVYYYNPSKNFQQGDNDEPLELPPGPNNPVGTVWIDLSQDTYGIHGTPEPAKIDKTYSHGCVRLTNWDAHELANLVETGAVVEFME